MEGECKKEEESVIVKEKEIKIKGDGDVVKSIGSVVGSGVLCGDGSTLYIQGITMKEKAEDMMTVPLVVWNGGYMNMSGVNIVCVGGGGGGSDVLINTSYTSGSVMSDCAIDYEWISLSALDRRRNADTDICTWNSGVIVLTDNFKFEMNAVRLNGSRNGGIVMSGGEITLSDCLMIGTADVSENYSSVKHNIVCSDEGVISVSTYDGEQITKSTSLWVLIGDCTLSLVDGGGGEMPESVLFVPRLDRVTYSNEATNRAITFSGAVLIACGLQYEILDPNGSLVTGSDLVSENDSVVSTTLRLSLIEGVNYSARLRFGAEKLFMTDAVSISREGSNMGSTVGVNTLIIIMIVVSVVTIALIASGICMILWQIMKKRNRNKPDDMNMVLLDELSDTQQIHSE